MNKIFLISLILILMSGCASTQRLSDNDRQLTKTIKVLPQVKKSQELYLLAPGAAVGLAFGPIGGLATAAANIAPNQALQAFVDKNQISIEKISQEEIETALRASGKFPVANPTESTDASVTITIEQFGFSVTNSFGSDVAPVLYLSCEMIDSKGEVIWSSSDRVLPSPFTEVDSITFEQMKSDPAMIEAAWRQAAKIIAKNIVETL